VCKVSSTKHASSEHAPGVVPGCFSSNHSSRFLSSSNFSFLFHLSGRVSHTPTTSTTFQNIFSRKVQLEKSLKRGSSKLLLIEPLEFAVVPHATQSGANIFGIPTQEFQLFGPSYVHSMRQVSFYPRFELLCLVQIRKFPQIVEYYSLYHRPHRSHWPACIYSTLTSWFSCDCYAPCYGPGISEKLHRTHHCELPRCDLTDSFPFLTSFSCSSIQHIPCATAHVYSSSVQLRVSSLSSMKVLCTLSLPPYTWYVESSSVTRPALTSMHFESRVFLRPRRVLSLQSPCTSHIESSSTHVAPRFFLRVLCTSGQLPCAPHVESSTSILLLRGRDVSK